MADIFISYTSSDRDWAFWIGKELEALGHTPHVHEWEIGAGDDIYAWMEQRQDAADYVLCVVSDEYLKAPYSTLERNAAQWQAVSKRPGFVLFVAVKPCRFPTLADHIRRCELFGVPEDAARLRFREFLKQPHAPTTVIYPGQVFALSNIPIRVPRLFMGRDDALAAVETALKRHEGRVAITALHGLRGVGKTTLAAAYAERHRSDYRATWWIRAQTEPTLRADLVALGVRLKWVEADDKEEPAFAATLERLRQEGEGILLIFDNAIDAKSLRPFLPRGGAAHVLVTSNAHVWRGLAEPVGLDLWPKSVGAEYLIARTSRQGERVAAEALSEVLGGLPLAHEQAAAYCERLGVSLTEYHTRFDAAPARLLDAQKDAPAEYHDGLTVAKTFALALEEAAKLHPAAESLIVHAALLAPEPIPLFLFSEARKHFSKDLASALTGNGLDEAVAALRTFALADRETIQDERNPAITTECIRLHRLVRQVTAARYEVKAREDMLHAPIKAMRDVCIRLHRLVRHLAAARYEVKAREDVLRVLVKAMAAVYPKDIYNDPNSWPRARRLDALALALVGGDTEPLPGTGAQTASLLNELAAYRREVLATYAQARPLHERALAIRKRVLGPGHPSTAQSLNNLAGLLHDQGDLASARPLYERALAINERVLRPDHPETAQSLNNLAGLLQAQGDLAGARPLYERALAINERVLGPDHPNTAASLNNLAGLLEDLGDLAGAYPLYKRALAIRERVLGLVHPDTATSLNNLAGILLYQGELALARSLCESALAIRERVFGLDHPSTAQSLNNLAGLLQAQGDLAGARPLYERALAINERVLGPDPPLISRTQGD